MSLASASSIGASFSNNMSRAIAMLDEIAPDFDDEMYFRAFQLLQNQSICDGFIALALARKKGLACLGLNSSCTVGLFLQCPW